jgi:hypothetical protein
MLRVVTEVPVRSIRLNPEPSIFNDASLAGKGEMSVKAVHFVISKDTKLDGKLTDVIPVLPAKLNEVSFVDEPNPKLLILGGKVPVDVIFGGVVSATTEEGSCGIAVNPTKSPKFTVVS